MPSKEERKKAQERDSAKKDNGINERKYKTVEEVSPKIESKM